MPQKVRIFSMFCFNEMRQTSGRMLSFVELSFLSTWIPRERFAFISTGAMPVWWWYRLPTIASAKIQSSRRAI